MKTVIHNAADISLIRPKDACRVSQRMYADGNSLLSLRKCVYRLSVFASLLHQVEVVLLGGLFDGRSDDFAGILLLKEI